MSEIELILTKLKIVSEEKENGMYLCDKKHSKILLDYIQQKENIIKEVRENLQNTLKINHHLKLCGNEVIQLDIDHIKYLIDKLEELKENKE